MTYEFYYAHSPLTAFIVVVNIILTIVVIFLERKQPSSTYAWLLFVWVVPVIGFLCYILFSQKFSSNRVYKMQKINNQRYNKKLAAQKAYIDDQREDILHQEYGPYLDNIEYHANVSHALYTNNNNIELFTDGKQMFEQMITDMAAAQSSINIEFYILKYDGLGHRILDLLEKKAQEGVEVRIIYDEIGSNMLGPGIKRRLRKAGAKIGAFLPSKLAFVSKYVQMRANYRDHRKIAVIDGQIGYIGGFNVGDEYLGLEKKFGYWRDTHIRFKGSAVQELQWRFLADWSTTGQEKVNMKDTQEFAVLFPQAPLHSGTAGMQIVASGPDTVNQVIKQGYLKMIFDANHRIRITSPYFVLDEPMLEALRIALLSGVEVDILIPCKPDHPFIYPTTLSYAGQLVEYGAKVYKYDNGFVHSKLMTVDDTLAVVGSCNFDIRSFALNFECSAFLYDKKITAELNEAFDKDIAKSELYTLEKYRNRSTVQRMKESVSRLLSPLL